MAFKFLVSSQTNLHGYIRSFSDFCRTQAFDLDSQSQFDFERSHSGSADCHYHCVASSSGPAQSSPELGGIAAPKVHVERKDTYICKGGVDAGRLLLLTRQSLYLTAKNLGGTALVDERWDCKITYPKLEGKSRKPDHYKVKIHYFAGVARSQWPDPKKPVDFDAAKGVRGLMTVLDRL